MLRVPRNHFRYENMVLNEFTVHYIVFMHDYQQQGIDGRLVFLRFLVRLNCFLVLVFRFLVRLNSFSVLVFRKPVFRAGGNSMKTFDASNI